VQRIVETTREAGYGVSFGDAKPSLGSVALPIRAAGRVVGGVNVVFLTGVVGRQSAVRKFMPALARAAAAIERNLAQG
jgi:IclR family mhp operon transcriptional activator